MLVDGKLHAQLQHGRCTASSSTSHTSDHTCLVHEVALVFHDNRLFGVYETLENKFKDVCDKQVVGSMQMQHERVDCITQGGLGLLWAEHGDYCSINGNSCIRCYMSALHGRLTQASRPLPGKVTHPAADWSV